MSIASNELVFSRLLLPVAERAADAAAVSDARARHTYAVHVDRVERLCDGLRSLGVGPSERFAVLAGNGHEFAELWHAAFFGAGVLNPLNFRLAAEELSFVLRDSGASVLFVDPAFAALSEELAGLGVDVPRIALDETYEDLLASARPVLPAEPDETDAAVLMYTGGTTGTPKGVVLSHRAEVLNLYHHQVVLRPEDGPVYLHQSPMFHGAAVYGLLGPPTTGGEMVFVDRFDPAAVVDAVERFGVTETQMAPTMIAMLLDSPAFDAARLASLRRLIFGGAPMPEGLFTRLRSALPDVQLFQGYGMTEVASVLTYLPHVERVPERIRSVGRAVPGVVLRAVGPDDEAVATGEPGEIVVRAGNLMSGYWNRPAETAEAMRGGWYHTGDVGYVDGDGYVHLVDRLKDMIITGGENVYSIEVEHVLSTHPAVRQVAVLGVPDDLWGQRVHAVVVVHEGAVVTPAELTAHARRYLARYKVPKTFDLRDQPLPVSGAMKVLKRALLAQYT